MAFSAAMSWAAFASFMAGSLPLLAPPCRDGLPCDGRPLGWRQRGSARLPALRRPELAQPDRVRVAGIWHFGRDWGLSGGFLNDLVGELVGVAGTLACHARIVAHRHPAFTGGDF